MRADPLRPASSVAAPRPRAHRAASGRFADLVGGPAAAAAAPLAAATALDALLALQEGDEGAGHQRARRHGADLLARLRRLQLAILGHGPSADDLAALLALCDSVPPCDGPTAQALEAIVLRARIELAKFP